MQVACTRDTARHLHHSPAVTSHFLTNVPEICPWPSKPGLHDVESSVLTIRPVLLLCNNETVEHVGWISCKKESAHSKNSK